MSDENKEYWLVREHQHFIDPHGTWDETNANKKFITNDPIFEQIQDTHCTGSYYDTHYFAEGRRLTEEELEESWDLTPIKDALENWSAEDGYNCQVITWDVTKITKEEADEYQKIIDQYKAL